MVRPVRRASLTPPPHWQRAASCSKTRRARAGPGVSPRKPFPWVATGCHRDSVVRRRSILSGRNGWLKLTVLSQTAPCCLARQLVHYTRTTQVLPGASRRKPVVAGSLGDEMPALAGNSGSQPAVAVQLVPACHAGGRGFESRRSRRKLPANRHLSLSILAQSTVGFPTGRGLTPASDGRSERKALQIAMFYGGVRGQSLQSSRADPARAWPPAALGARCALVAAEAVGEKLLFCDPGALERR
jgi:hypothetical protein